MKVALICILTAIPAAADPLRILFIGNSLTGANDLPATVCRLAAASGKDARCESVVRGGFSLADHLAEGEAAKRIREGKFDIVVLQQGPSALDSSRAELIQSARTFAKIIRAAGGRPALYAVWPSKSRSFDFANVARSYRLAAQDVDVDGLLFAAGEAWTEAWRRDRALPLYGSDDFHPSPAGSYLAALVIHRAIWGELPDRFAEPDVAKIALTRAQLRILLEAANRWAHASGAPYQEHENSTRVAAARPRARMSEFADRSGNRPARVSGDRNLERTHPRPGMW
jgi:hypothetical protein